MRNLIRRWFGGSTLDGDDVDASIAAVRGWAKAEGHRFAISRGSEGFVVEPGNGGWRAEWGPSQRGYIDGNELRVRADIGAAGDLQMLLIGRFLADRLEHEVFEQFTEGNQTRIDDRTPEEMRWLVLYPQVPRAVMADLLGEARDRFVLLASRPVAAPMWVEGALAKQLRDVATWHADGRGFAMIVQRGRFVLRLGSPRPEVQALQRAVALAGVAAASARRVGAEAARGRLSSQRPSGWASSTATPNKP